MAVSRREFVQLVSGGIATGVLPWASTLAVRSDVPPAVKAVAFDAFPILDPRPVFRLAVEHFPDRGAELGNVWRTRQFEYQWLRALAGQYVDFWQATEDALMFAARMLNLDLTPGQRSELMSAFLKLEAWPDVPAALTALRTAGLRLAFLSNATPEILHAGIRNSKLDGVFEHVLSTDAVRTFKPDRRAYQIGVDAFGVTPDEILFVAFAGWDAAGAKWFGYPTFWVNRLEFPIEELGVVPDGIGKTMDDLLHFLGPPAPPAPA